MIPFLIQVTFGNCREFWLYEEFYPFKRNIFFDDIQKEVEKIYKLAKNKVVVNGLYYKYAG